MAESTKQYDVGGVLLPRPFKIRRLGHFGWYADDAPMLQKFYRDVLGYKDADVNFVRFMSDHHNLALIPRDGRLGAGRKPLKPSMKINQISWQVQSVSDAALAPEFFTEHEIELWRFGRDGTGNWSTYPYDPDGNKNEVFFGMDQIGWDGYSKPVQWWKTIGFAGKIQMPVKAEFDEIQDIIEASGLSVTDGHRHIERAEAKFAVDGLMLRQPFKIVNHGPVSLLVEDLDDSLHFYKDLLGFRVTEEVVWEGQRCVFLRHSSEHHSVALYPAEVGTKLGLGSDSNCLSFGLQIANYRQLKQAIVFLREQGVRVETGLIPPELHPGIDYAAHAFDPEGNCLELYYYMERVGWDGKPRPASSRPKINDENWPDVLEGQSDAYDSETYLGSW